MPQLKRLTNPYRAVFRSYRQRPMFWVLGAVWLIFPVERFLPLLVGEPRFNSAPFLIEHLIFDFALPLHQLVLPIVFTVAFMSHLRQQLAGPARMLIPNYRQPHLRVAASIFVLAAVVLPFTPVWTERLFRSFLAWQHPDWNLGAIGPEQWIGEYAIPFLITLTLMTITAWFASFITSWIAVIFAPIIFIALAATGFNPWSMLRSFFEEFYGLMPGAMIPISIGYIVYAIILPLLGVVLTILFNLFALIALWRRMHRIATSRIVDELPTSRALTAESPAVSLRHETLSTGWARIRRLRSAGITLAAPWIVALLLATILLLIVPLLLGRNPAYLQMQISLILITILPSVAVSLLWAERWPRLAVESLLPASRPQFITEIIAAIAVDLLHFWIAIAVAATLPLLLVPLKPFDGTMFAERLLASGLMQPIAFAVILWAMWLRSWPTLAILLCLAIGIMAGPLCFTSKQVPIIAISTLLPLSLFIATLGIALSATAYHRWLRGNWV